MTKGKYNDQEFENQEFDNGAQVHRDPHGDSAESQPDANVAEEGEAEDDNSSQNSDNAEQWRDKYMRLSAEFDNYRKRTVKEKMELINMGGEDVIKAMLPVLDDMDRAIGAMQTSEDIDAVRQGIELISHKLRETLKGKGLSEMECVGKELDTDFHEAIAKVPGQSDQDKGKIVDVAQKGYSLKNKVIRHAKVVVGE